jgi:hypothetical protein
MNEATIPGLTAGQLDIVEMTLKMAPPELHDGLCRVIAAALFITSSPPYHTRDVTVAAETAVAAYSGIWFPAGLFSTGGNLDGEAGLRMIAASGMSGAGGLQVDMV